MAEITPVKAFSLQSSSADDLDSGDEVEEILRKARVSINSSYGIMSGSDSNLGKSKKAAGVTFTGVPDSPVRSVSEHGEDGLIKTQKLMEKMKQIEVDLSAERALRKKKDKNIMKLAQQLKRRNAEYDEDAEKLEKFSEQNRDLEQKLILAQKELKQQDALHKRYMEDNKKDYERTIAQQQEKYSKTCAEHDARITEISKSHAQQCEELCREILNSNLEADRLQSRINTIEGTNEQRPLPLINSKLPRMMQRQRRRWAPLLVVSIIAIIVGVGVSTKREYLCAPARPGKIIKEKSSTSFRSPWWAPEPIKDTVYQTLCSSETSPSRLDWILDSSGFKIVLWKDGKTTISKRATSAEVNAGGLRLWNKKGYGEEIASAWT